MRVLIRRRRGGRPGTERSVLDDTDWNAVELGRQIETATRPDIDVNLDHPLAVGSPRGTHTTYSGTCQQLRGVLLLSRCCGLLTGHLRLLPSWR